MAAGVPPQQAAPPEAAPAAPQGGGKQVDPVALHKLALQAEKNAEQLATGLAHAGADEGATKAVGQCADLLRKVAAGLAKAAGSQQPPEAAAQPQQPQGRPTMDDAHNALAAELAARRGQK